jgi:diacylglycerol kinase (ATP)
VDITNGPGDATESARQAVAEGVDAVGVYGGNGTVAEVAEGLAGSGVPLWILPGGTGNGTARELGLPLTLGAAAGVLVAPGTRVETVDLGRVGDRVFVLRAGIGAIVEVDRLASREVKDRVGGLAYVTAGLDVLRRTKPSGYRVTVDDEIVERNAVACIVANGAGFGAFGVLAEGVSMSDGILDVFLYGPEELVARASGPMEDQHPLQSLSLPTPRVGSGRRIRVETETRQSAVADGEYAGDTPIDIEVLPTKLAVLLPPADEGGGVPRPPRPPWDSEGRG